ncbi:MAG: hypothetical protein IKP35_00250 [Alphaproteobacteria bacterium]|nr:hypothetical protein [Alphaproteobacteria bacterium]
MMKNRKPIINRISARYMSIILLIMLVYATAFCAIICNLNHHPANKPETKKEMVKTSVIDVSAVLISAFLITLHLVNLHKKANAFASHIVRNYIRQMMRGHPALKQYQSVLTNPKTLQIVANGVSNALPDDTKKTILQIIRDSDILNIDGSSFRMPRPHTVKNIRKAISQITSVIERYAKNNPEFIFKIYSVMEIAQKSMMNSPNKTNTKTR